VIQYELPVPGPVVLEIFDQTGGLVRRFTEDPRSAGPHAVKWDGRDRAGRAVPSGIYLTRIETPLGVATGRVVLTR